MIDSGSDQTGRSEITGPQLRPAPQLAKVWRERAQWAVRGVDPPTQLIALPGGDEDVSQRYARAVIDLTLRIGEAMLATGGSSADVTATMLRVTGAYGIRSAHVDITFSSLAVSIHRGLDEDPLTVMRVVALQAPDYSRLQQLQLVVDQITGRGEPDHTPLEVATARKALERALRRPHPYRHWVVTAASGTLAAGVVALFDSGPITWLFAALTAALVDVVKRALRKSGVAAFFNQAVCAAIPTVVAAGLYWLRDRDLYPLGDDSPSLVVIAGIVVLLAGLTALGAAKDALDGYYVTAGARGLEVIMMTAGIAVGVSLGLGIAAQLGVPITVNPDLPLGRSFLVAVIAAGVIGLSFAMSTYAPPRAALVAGVVAMAGWATLQVANSVAPATGFSVAIAASVVGFAGYLTHRVLRVPELAITTAGIVSMLPGLAIYRALNAIMGTEQAMVISAATEAFEAVGIGLGLAAGISIGGFAARRTFEWDRANQRVNRRSRGAVD